jgi:hypothetical protein
MTEGIPLGVEIVAGMAETATAEVLEAVTSAPGKCILQCVLTAALRPRSRSNLLKEDRFTAGTAFRNTGSSKPGNYKYFSF